MASKIKVAPQKQEATKGCPANAPDRSVLDHSNAAVEELIRSAKKHGFVTVAQIDFVLPSKETASEQISDILSIWRNWREGGRHQGGRSEEEAAIPEKSEEELEGDHDLVEVQQRPSLVKSGPGTRRAGRRPRAHVSARNGHGGTPIAGGRDRHRQAHRGQPRGHDRGTLREPAHLPGHRHPADELNEGKVFCATSSTSTRPMPAPTPRPCRRRWSAPTPP